MTQEIEIRDWPHFSKIANNFDVGNLGSIPFAFRGHSKEEWLLAPTLLRHFDHQNKSIEEVLEIESLALAKFRSQAHLHLEPNMLNRTTDIVSWWTIMQHYGAPTRLLDWTQSIYVAAYFAVNDHIEEDGAVWVVHVAPLNEKMKFLYGDKPTPKSPYETHEIFCRNDSPPLLGFVERFTLGERMITQQGIFSVSHNVLSDHEEILRRNLDSKSLEKLIIPKEQKRAFTKKLRSMNLTASSLFPGLDGLGKSIREFVNLA